MSVVKLAQRAAVDPLAMKQFKGVTRNLPGIVRAVALPNLSPGDKYPEGAVFVSQDWIHPHLAGSDIGCGTSMYRTTLSPDQLNGDQGHELTERLVGLEGSWTCKENRFEWLQQGNDNFTAGYLQDEKLGTIGGGSHFAELQVVERSDSDLLKSGEVILLIHSGSRGYGADILERFEPHLLDNYTRYEKPALRVGDMSTMQYLQEHDRACNWARLNRDLIALRFLACVEPEEHSWNLHTRGIWSGCFDASAGLRLAKYELLKRKIVDVTHNHIEEAASSPGKNTWIHRKGASSTTNPTTAEPLPILPLLGSFGTPTFIMSPKLSEANAYGANNAHSIASSAGRAMSIEAAMTLEAARLQHFHITQDPSLETYDVRGDSRVICEDLELALQEAPEAFRDVQTVANDLVAKGVAEIKAVLRPRITYKVRCMLDGLS